MHSKLHVTIYIELVQINLSRNSRYISKIDQLYLILQLKKVLFSIDFQKLLISVIRLGEKADLWANEVLMALAMMFLFSLKDLIFSRIFFQNQPQLRSTCSLRYFFSRLMSQLESISINFSAGRAQIMAQLLVTYLDFNLLLVMISSSPKKSYFCILLLLLNELQTALTSHLRCGSGHLLCYLMQMWFSYCIYPLNKIQKYLTSLPASSTTCPLK